jgi:hypothetical protein
MIVAHLRGPTLKVRLFLVCKCSDPHELQIPWTSGLIPRRSAGKLRFLAKSPVEFEESIHEGEEAQP